MTLTADLKDEIFPSQPLIGTKAAIRHTESAVRVNSDTKPKIIYIYIYIYILAMLVWFTQNDVNDILVQFLMINYA